MRIDGPAENSSVACAARRCTGTEFSTEWVGCGHLQNPSVCDYTCHARDGAPRDPGAISQKTFRRAPHVQRSTRRIFQHHKRKAPRSSWGCAGSPHRCGLISSRQPQRVPVYRYRRRGRAVVIFIYIAPPASRIAATWATPRGRALRGMPGFVVFTSSKPELGRRSVIIMRSRRGFAVVTTCSVTPRMRMIGEPNTKKVCQSLVFAPIDANTRTTIDTPIKMPVMKLPASRNLATEFFMIHSDPDNHCRLPQDSPCVGALTAK